MRNTNAWNETFISLLEHTRESCEVVRVELKLETSFRRTKTFHLLTDRT